MVSLHGVMEFMNPKFRGFGWKMGILGALSVSWEVSRNLNPQIWGFGWKMGILRSLSVSWEVSRILNPKFWGFGWNMESLGSLSVSWEVLMILNPRIWGLGWTMESVESLHIPEKYPGSQIPIFVIPEALGSRDQQKLQAQLIPLPFSPGGRAPRNVQEYSGTFWKVPGCLLRCTTCTWPGGSSAPSVTASSPSCTRT